MKYPETILQSQVCRYIKLQYPKAIFHHSPNEGKRTVIQQRIIKALGVSSGFPDLIICNEGKIICIELKAGKNKETESQRKWIDVIKSCGIPAMVCNGFEKAKLFIDFHFQKSNTR